jgi:hypothetical protein
MATSYLACAHSTACSQDYRPLRFSYLVAMIDIVFDARSIRILITMQLSSSPPARLATILAITLFFLTACNSAFVQDVQNLMPLRDSLVATYHVDDVNLVVQNGHALGISFINSPFNDLPSTAKEPKAREIAQFAAKHYESIDHIDEIWVGFVVDKQYIIMHYTNNFDTYFFKKAELLGGEQSKGSRPVMGSP